LSYGRSERGIITAAPESTNLSCIPVGRGAVEPARDSVADDCQGQNPESACLHLPLGLKLAPLSIPAPSILACFFFALIQLYPRNWCYLAV